MRLTAADEYIESLRGRGLRVFLFGEFVAEPVDHPMIRPSINAMADNECYVPLNPGTQGTKCDAGGRRLDRRDLCVGFIPASIPLPCSGDGRFVSLPARRGSIR
jgi:hypothetical protein